MQKLPSIKLTRPTNIFRWARLYILYRTAFPRYERKPFSIIVKMMRKGKTDVWYCTCGDRFAGFAATINGGHEILVDYFAVAKAKRGGGVGSAMLRALREKYVPNGLFVEIESVYAPSDNRSERQRRKNFYLANGLEEMGVLVSLFDTDMELLGSGCTLDFEGYRAFYRDNYNEWAAEHVKPAEHPKER